MRAGAESRKLGKGGRVETIKLCRAHRRGRASSSVHSRPEAPRAARIAREVRSFVPRCPTPAHRPTHRSDGHIGDAGLRQRSIRALKHLVLRARREAAAVADGGRGSDGRWLGPFERRMSELVHHQPPTTHPPPTPPINPNPYTNEPRRRWPQAPSSASLRAELVWPTSLVNRCPIVINCYYYISSPLSEIL